MKIYLEEPEIITIRDALISHRKSLELSYDSNPDNKKSQLVTDVIEGAYAKMDKLIAFFDQKLFKDDKCS